MTAKRFFILIDDEYEDTLPAIRDRTFKIKDIYGHYRYDNLEEICNELNRLNDENEQLKCGNKNLKAILNDFINILNRLQSNPTDKQTLGVARDMLQNMGKELKE